MLSWSAVRVGLTGLALLLAVGACGGAPPRAPRSTQGRLDAVAREVFAALTSGEAAQVLLLQARDPTLVDLFQPGFLEVVLSQRRVESRGHERISSEWRPFREGRYQGFCARRVGPGTTDVPGLDPAVPAIGELVLVGRDAAGEWAGVVHDLVRTAAGYRLVRWTVDAPRRDHFVLEQWACDFGSRRP